MHVLELDKPDGRDMTLYGRGPVVVSAGAPSPFAEPLNMQPHMRWHPLRGEWVLYAAARQDRTFLPPPRYNPFAVTRDVAAPTEMPPGEYDIAVFDNRFPALSPRAEDAPHLAVPTAPAKGRCEVVVYTQNPDGALAYLSLDRIELLLQVWADRTARCARAGETAYVMPFENRGAEVGVTLHHPHGQLYAYPFIPPVPERALQREREYYARHHAALLLAMARQETVDAERVLYQGPHAIAFVPVCARYPYEVWITPLHPVADFAALDDAARADLARALKTVLLKFDGLWQRPFPYLMIWYQAPTDGQAHPETQLHAEFFPPYRSRDRLKYLAGTELGAGTFAMDRLPESGAQELQAVHVDVERA